MSDIKIANRIEVLPGNKIMVPGCEPVSSLTSTSLDENRVCHTTVVDLGAALEALPGSTVAMTLNPRRKWFVLPSGPPPNPGKCDTGGCHAQPDWYAILRSLGHTKKMAQPDQDQDICSAFPLRGIFG